jgi:sugar O-acyltransferase (sialic acid O-acetyltransferase NeuD family)
VVAAADLVVVGGSGHGREILDIVAASEAHARRWRTVGVVDDDESVAGLVAGHGVRYLGGLAVLDDHDDVDVVLGIGSERVRQDVDERFDPARFRPVVLEHPSATVGPGNHLSPGVVLFAGARVTTNVRLGRHTHLNVNSSVSHDCVIGDHTTVSPGAVVAGGCVVGHRVLVGAGATILQGRRVGDGAVVGAGAVVVDDVAEGVTVVGVPARPLRR